MRFEQSFEVEAPLERVWEALLDVERVAPCLPGARITEAGDDGSFRGEFSVRLGPATAAYRGDLVLAEADAAAHRSTMRAGGQDKRGQGSAKATIVTTLRDEGERTRVDVETELLITGRLARFGRAGMIEDVSNRLLRDFAACLREALEPPEPAGPSEAQAPAAAGPREAQAPAAPGPAPPGLAAGPRAGGAVRGLELLLSVAATRIRRLAGRPLERGRRSNLARRRYLIDIRRRSSLSAQVRRLRARRERPTLDEGAAAMPHQLIPGPVLVVGGSGRTGRLLAADLVPHAEVRVLARNPDGCRDRLPPECQVFEGSVLRPPSLAPALDGVAYVVITNAGDGTWSNRPELVDVIGTRHLIEEMPEDAAVLLVSSIAVTRPEHAFDTDPYSLAWKAGAEELVRSCGRRYAIVRPGWLVDSKRRPGLRFGQGDVLDGRLSRDALAEVCARMLCHEEAWGKTFEVVEGPDAWPEDWAGEFAALDPDLDLSTKTLKARGAEITER